MHIHCWFCCPAEGVSKIGVRPSAAGAILRAAAVESIKDVNRHGLSDRQLRILVVKHKKPHFADEPRIDDGSFAEIEIPIVSLEVCGAIGQCKSADALVSELVRIVIPPKIQGVVLGQEYLAVNIQIFILGRSEYSLVDAAAWRDGKDRCAFLLDLYGARVKS